jgi:hypothetical protein
MGDFDELTADDLLDIRDALMKPPQDRAKIPCYLTPFGYAVQVDGEWLNAQTDLVPVGQRGILEQ